MTRKILKIEIIIILIVAFFILTCFVSNTLRERYYDSLDGFGRLHEESWVVKNKVVSHAAGGIDNLEYTNSKEALDNTINNGINIVEIDFGFTSDGHLICYHTPNDIHWKLGGSKPSLDEFLSLKIQGEFTPLTAEDIIKYMKENPNLYIAIDTKEKSLVPVVEKIVELCDEKILLNRFIIQCNYPGDKTKISKIYSFPEENYVFAIYKYSQNPYDILAVCYKENINIVLAPYYIWDAETIKMFKDKNIYLYLHTVNREDIANLIMYAGAHGIYTDYLFDFKY